jgi:hypothetical protein
MECSLVLFMHFTNLAYESLWIRMILFGLACQHLYPPLLWIDAIHAAARQAQGEEL